MQLQQLTDLMLQLGVAQAKDLVGVPLADIRALENHFGLKFPACYVQFLHKCGRSAGHLAGWAAMYFDDLKEIAEEFEFHAALNNSAQLLPDRGLLIAHYGQLFDYLVCDGSPEPAIFRITFSQESGARCERFADNYAHYLEAIIRKAGREKSNIEPFFIDECGNMVYDDMTAKAPTADL
ncbi:MAG TPA: SMI1/KNR4 family protein [Marinagarivorans sp.]